MPSAANLLEAGGATPRKIWWVLVPALLLPTLSALAFLVVFNEAAISKPIYIATKIFTLLWPVVATVWILRQRLGLGSASGARHWRSMRFGLVVGLAILAVMVAWMKSPLNHLILDGAEGVEEKLVSLGFLEHFIPFAVFVTVAHSFIEEFYWRWFVFGNLRKVLPLPAAHGVSAVGFAANHLVITCQYYSFWFALALSVCVAIGGLIWSLLYQRYGSLLGPWISHLCVDAGLMWVGYQLVYP